MENMNFFEERPLNEVSIAELSAMVTEAFSKRREVEDLERIVKEKNASLDELKQKILSILEANNQDNFPVAGVGTVYTSQKLSVSMPKDPDKAAVLREFFVNNGMADYLTVNHQSLNSIYKERVEEAQRKGLPIADVIPGLAEPSVYVTIGMRKGK